LTDCRRIIEERNADRPGINAMYIIPKKDATLNGSQKWKDTMKGFIQNTMGSAASGAIRRPGLRLTGKEDAGIGWGIAQRRDDRIDSALFCTGLWHIPFNLDR